MKKRITLIADEGKALTDGATYFKQTHLEAGDEGEYIREVEMTDEEYAEILKSEEAMAEGMNV